MRFGNRGKKILINVCAAALAVGLLISGQFADYRGSIDMSTRLSTPIYLLLILVLAAIAGGFLVAFRTFHGGGVDRTERSPERSL